MTEYIEREAALESVREKLMICDSLPDTIAKDASLFTLASIQDSLKSIPAADVRPVVRGRWEKCVGENGVTSACRCSLCGFEDNRFSMFNYCPNCGADMRGEES